MKRVKKHLSILSMLVALMLLTITSCTGDKEEKLICKVSVISGKGGTAISSENEVVSGLKVTLTATPQEGYSFVNWTVNGAEVSTENPYTATITEDTEFVANFNALKGEENGHTWIDLGLPSGLKWATCNVGADSPEEYGDYFAWGETIPKTTYNWSTYKYCNGPYNTMTKYCTKSNYGTVDNKTTLELADDAAHVNWGGKWRMPTISELNELRNTSNCTWTETTQNGVYGYKVTSVKNGNFIFLPAAGYRSFGSLDDAGHSGIYWSSSLHTYRSHYAYYLNFFWNYVGWFKDYRFVELSVRAVCE